MRYSTDKTFPLSEIAKAFGLDYDLVYKRVKRGWHWCDALSTEAHASRKASVHSLLDKRAGFSYYAIAKAFELPTATLISRLNSGWGWQAALCKPRKLKQEVSSDEQEQEQEQDSSPR